MIAEKYLQGFHVTLDNKDVKSPLESAYHIPVGEYYVPSEYIAKPDMNHAVLYLFKDPKNSNNWIISETMLSAFDYVGYVIANCAEFYKSHPFAKSIDDVYTYLREEVEDMNYYNQGLGWNVTVDDGIKIRKYEDWGPAERVFERAESYSEISV